MEGPKDQGFSNLLAVGESSGPIGCGGEIRARDRVDARLPPAEKEPWMSNSPISIKPVLAAAEIAEAVCSLPAVATFDWCDAAASCLTRLADPSWRCVSIITLDPTGSIRMCEATGAAGGPTAAGQVGPRARPTP